MDKVSSRWDLSSVLRLSIGDSPVVDVRMFVLDRFRWRPNGGPNSWNLLKNQGMSMMVRNAAVSSK